MVNAEQSVAKQETNNSRLFEEMLHLQIEISPMCSSRLAQQKLGSHFMKSRKLSVGPPTSLTHSSCVNTLFSAKISAVALQPQLHELCTGTTQHNTRCSPPPPPPLLIPHPLQVEIFISENFTCVSSRSQLFSLSCSLCTETVKLCCF